jgi:cytochrome b561
VIRWTIGRKRCVVTTKSRNSSSTVTPSKVSRRPADSFGSLRWLNGSVHWISGVVLLYAFISNGDTTNAMINPAAMRGEVKLGLLVGLIFLIRLIWVQSRRSGGGRWVGPSVRLPHSKIRTITDWGIYLGVAASVVSGLLIAYLRSGAQLVPTVRGFTTDSAVLNATVDAHAFVSDALEWLCGFHAMYALWHWAIKRTQWGRAAKDWIGRTATASRVATSRLGAKAFRL